MCCFKLLCNKIVPVGFIFNKHPVSVKYGDNAINELAKCLTDLAEQDFWIIRLPLLLEESLNLHIAQRNVDDNQWHLVWL